MQAQRPKAKPRLDTEAAKPKAPTSERIKVNRFVVDGASLIPTAELEALLAGYAGQMLDLSELDAAAQLISNHYRAQGWYARAILPAQDVTEGTVRIQVIESRFGAVTRTDKGTRTKGDFIERMVLAGHQSGEPLSASRLERGILLANDLPGVKASILLEPGKETGDTIINLTTDDTPLLSGDLGLNNFGVKSTGTTQFLGGIALNSPTGYGDQLAVRVLATERLTNTSLSYSLPLGTNGVRLAAYGSYLDYKLGDQFKALNAKGDADTTGLSLNWAAIRRHRVDSISLGLSGDRADSIGGGGLSWGNLRLISGELDIHSVAADIAIDRLTARADGHYSKLAWGLNRLQSLGESGLRILAAANGQFASKNLSSSEQFSLGGPYGVRAFPVNEATGDQGALLQLELQKPFGNGWQLAGFIDTGTISQHKTTWTGWSPLNRPNTYSLSGAGLSLSFNKANDLSFNATIAAPIGGNPGKDARGRNNDGSKVDEARLWASISKAF